MEDEDGYLLIVPLGTLIEHKESGNNYYIHQSKIRKDLIELISGDTNKSAGSYSISFVNDVIKKGQFQIAKLGSEELFIPIEVVYN